jgi:hypothetical protein
VKLLRVWKFSGDGRDADNLAEAIGIATQHGSSGLLVKALDGTDWMRTYDASADPSPRPIRWRRVLFLV